MFSIETRPYVFDIFHFPFYLNVAILGRHVQKAKAAVFMVVAAIGLQECDFCSCFFFELEYLHGIFADLSYYGCRHSLRQVLWCQVCSDTWPASTLEGLMKGGK